MHFGYWGAMAVAGIAGMLAPTADAAENLAVSESMKAAFEVAFGAGAEYGPFSTIGPFGLQQFGFVDPPQPVIRGDLSGWSTTFDGHMTFRPAEPGLFWVDAFRLDLGYADGSASYHPAQYGPVGGQANEGTALPSVDGTILVNVGALDLLVDAGVEQSRESISVRPSLVFDRRIGGIEVSTRLGAGYSGLTQHEAISVSAVFDGFPGTSAFNTLTRGDLDTHGFGPLAALDFRSPVTETIAIVAGLEGTLAFARTTYDGESSGSVGIVPFDAVGVSDRRDHLMAGVFASAGPEWRPLPNLTVSLLGTLGLYGGVPHVVYPQTELDNIGNPVVIGGPAHIGLETLWSAGVRFEAELTF